MGEGFADLETVRGLQTLGITTTFNLEQVFEIGQLALYENIEGIPDIEVSTEKVLDGYSPVYLLATQADVDGTVVPTSALAGRAAGICNVGVSIYPETDSNAQGTALTNLQMSGMYVSSVSYNASVDGNATESCTLVGNNKVWVLGGDTAAMKGYVISQNTYDSPWTTTTQPKSISDSGGVNQREDVIFGSAVGLSGVSVLPINIPGITNAGDATNPSGINELGSDGCYGAAIQNWSMNVDLGREELFELGKRGSYYRYVNFPVEVTNEFGVISTSGDLISATEEGLYGSEAGCGGLYNLIDQPIRLVMCEGLVVNCGSQNKLSSVGVSGGDAGGGNMEVSYSYTNFNDFDVKHPSDPNTALWPGGTGDDISVWDAF